MIGPAPICLKCRHFDSNEKILTCRAFPTGIPDVFIDAEIEHRQPYPGDNGIQFEEKTRTRELGFVQQ